MSIQPRLFYNIDAADRLSSIAGAWAEFADANGGYDLSPDAILGRSLWDFVSDATVLGVYGSILTRVRQGRGPIGFQFRCDAPERRRLMRMDISNIAEGVQFAVTMVREELRNPVVLLDSGYPRTADMMLSCGWCMRIKVGDDWLEPEDAVNALGLFEGVPVPRLSHGMCARCHQQMLDVMG